MEFAKKNILEWKEKGYLHVAYALLFELLSIAAIFFAALFLIEMILPTYITARLSLAKFFFFFLLGLLLLFLIAKTASIHFKGKFSWRHPLSLASLVWASGILLLSVYKFPVWAIPFLLLFFAFLLFGIFQLFFRERK